MNGTLNKVMLLGILGWNKMHYFDGGNCIGDSISHKWSLYQQNDERKITSTEWHNLVVRNKAAEICENICQRDKIYVEGRIKSRQWQTEDGTTKHTWNSSNGIYFCLLKGNENNKQIDSSESTKTLTLTHKIMGLSMICHFDCLTNLLKCGPRVKFAYTLDTDLMFGFMEYLFCFFALH
jgi:single-strand DNA-binding protein